jgi:predicted nuclease of restriction endonuclease-like (RecB) superfamily
MSGKQNQLDFAALVKAIEQVDEHLAAQAGRAVNVALTVRNWLIGRSIAEFELHGADRAVYGQRLLDELSTALKKGRVSATGRRQLYGYLAFYRTYPQIVRTLSAQLRQVLPGPDLPARSNRIVRTASAQSKVPANDLLNRLAYSHLEQLVAIEDSVKRAFYEFECLRGNWSVRELRRQIGSLYYERSGLSRNKSKLAKLAHAGVETAEPRLAIRDSYVFEFLGLKAKEVMGESDLEDALLDKLQDFILELGHGFCFEARQKRILIGQTHGFIDLVFYHRILKCHVLLDLKLAPFGHEHLGQLNTYVSWYRKHMMAKGDHPPIGLLLCTGQDQALVEYALAGMDNRLFVSRYQLELPAKEKLQRFLQRQLRQAGGAGRGQLSGPKALPLPRPQKIKAQGKTR